MKNFEAILASSKKKEQEYIKELESSSFKKDVEEFIDKIIDVLEFYIVEYFNYGKECKITELTNNSTITFTKPKTINVTANSLIEVMNPILEEYNNNGFIITVRVSVCSDSFSIEILEINVRISKPDNEKIIREDDDTDDKF